MLRIKYLGVIINDKLKWCELISYVKNKVSWSGVIINKVSWCTNLNGVNSYHMLRIKYLGVIINDKLKWCELISYVKNKVSWCNYK